MIGLSGGGVAWRGGICTRCGGGVARRGSICTRCARQAIQQQNVRHTFRHNGYFGNPSNSDYGQITLFGNEPQNCFAGNHAPDGSAPANLEQTQPTCGVTTTAANTGGDLFAQVLCDTGLGPCPAGATYPKPNGAVILKPLPRSLPTMPDPCAGVPANPWCPARH
jgi:hypothetical protein